MTTAATQPALTDARFHALCDRYLIAKAAKEQAVAEFNQVRDEITELVLVHGFLPPRATKSKRLLTPIFRATVSQGQEIQINGTLAAKLCAKVGRRIFGRLFRTEVVYVPVPEGAKFVDKLPAPLRNLYRSCFQIESKSPSLDVERLQEAKAEKEPAA